ncbi:MAG: hypothetical protein JW769_01320 [Parachlamydiales bacterium]|nr:hypothetical protein [Parachlamydiales bacterium]
MKTNKLSRSVFNKYWWIFCVLLIGAFVYHQAIQSKNHDIEESTHRLQELEKEKKLALQEREDLLLQIHSQSDPAWIELVLMKKLGVVPMGQIKVHFTNQNRL